MTTTVFGCYYDLLYIMYLSIYWLFVEKGLQEE
jgi:hypothetical protein